MARPIVSTRLIKSHKGSMDVLVFCLSLSSPRRRRYFVDLGGQSNIRKNRQKGGNRPLHSVLAAPRGNASFTVEKALIKVFPESVNKLNGGRFTPLHSFLTTLTSDREKNKNQASIFETILQANPAATRHKSLNKKFPCHYNC